MGRISARPQTYVEEPEAWGAGYYDLWALALWYTGRAEEARAAVRRALELRPGTKRLINNLRLMGADDSEL